MMIPIRCKKPIFVVMKSLISPAEKLIAADTFSAYEKSADLCKISSTNIFLAFLKRTWGDFARGSTNNYREQKHGLGKTLLLFIRGIKADLLIASYVSTNGERLDKSKTAINLYLIKYGENFT